MTKTMNWRFKTLPTIKEVQDLITGKVISNEEARAILFTEKEETERDTKSLEEEIKFLRTLVEKLSTNQSSKIVEVIREVYRPWHTYPSNYSLNAQASSTGSGQLSSFTNIKKF